jgi:hypothetical protein
MQDDAVPDEHNKEVRRGWTATRIALALAVVALGSALLWTTDRITLQGERTIYAVDCADGAWSGSACTGRLVAGPRYAFRASAARREVLYWVRGSGAPSGKLTDCTVTDRDNWSCAAVDVKPATIAFEMVKGRPTRSGNALTLPFHSVPKWRWWLIKAGFGGFHEARD